MVERKASAEVMSLRPLGLCFLMGLSACGGPADSAPPQAKFHSEIVAQGLSQPWALAFLPDGRMLVTEKSGQMRIVDAQGKITEPLDGVPAVANGGQGGLLDVVLDPQFAKTQRIYFSYSEPREGGNATAVAYATLEKNQLSNLKIIFQQQPAMKSNKHFGSRLVFAPDGNLFITLGERGIGQQLAQNVDNDIGKVVRVDREGQVPSDNPFLKKKDARPELWSLGHRNPQGAAINPKSGKLWTNEHGPKGGDEINVPMPGRNYGWPLITYGVNYSGTKVGDGESQRIGLEQPIHFWVPSIAPSGMAFYTASRFPQWQGNLFVGSLKFGQLVRLQLDGEKITHEERHELGSRIRDVRQGPDGYLYLLTDEADGKILRLSPG